jgi:nucleotide-binding universal stress UspA family protein
MREPTPIVAAVDASPRSDAVISAASDLAQRLGLPLHLIAVVERAYADTARAAQRDRFLRRERQVIEECYGIDVTTHVGVGDPANYICDYATAVDGSLVVVGTSHHTRITRALLGSTVEAIVLQATCPILVVRSTSGTWPPSHVVVGEGDVAYPKLAAGIPFEIAREYGIKVTTVRIGHGAPAIDGSAAETGHRTLVALTTRDLKDLMGRAHLSHNAAILHRGNGPLFIMPLTANTSMTSADSRSDVPVAAVSRPG